MNKVLPRKKKLIQFLTPLDSDFADKEVNISTIGKKISYVEFLSKIFRLLYWKVITGKTSDKLLFKSTKIGEQIIGMLMEVRKNISKFRPKKKSRF